MKIKCLKCNDIIESLSVHDYKNVNVEHVQLMVEMNIRELVEILNTFIGYMMMDMKNPYKKIMQNNINCIIF